MERSCSKFAPLVAIPVFSLVLSCGHPTDQIHEETRLVGDFVLLASSPQEDLLIHLVNEHTLEIVHSRGSTLCPLSEDVARGWSSIKRLVMVGEPESHDSLSIDPNTRSSGGIVALFRVEGESRFDSWQIEDDERLFAAADLIQSIADECGADLEYRLFVVDPGETMDARSAVP